MNPFLRGLARAVSETFTLPGPILEVGSYIIDGQEKIGDLRSCFPGRPYVGVDKRPGPGVDIVADVERLPQADAAFGTVIALSTFEHVERFWKGFDEIHRVLRPDGVFLVSTPFYFRIHEHPNDYWRFTPEALELLLRPYPNKIIGWHGPKKRPANVWALAFGPDHPAVTSTQYALYQSRMNQYCQMPLSFCGWLRYQVGSLLCGHRPFAPFLDREHWQSRWLNTKAG